MFKRLRRGWRHAVVLMQALPVGARRRLLRRMAAFSRTLPRQFDRPLPAMLAEMTPPAGRREIADTLTGDDIRRLADAVAAWRWRSPLGLCLRRSLLRYRFLRQANIPVTIVFGARLKDDREGGGIGGHAWLTLNGVPYYEKPGDYEGFVEMYRYPEEERR